MAVSTSRACSGPCSIAISIFSISSSRRRVVDRHGLPPRSEFFPAGGGELVRLLPVVLGDGDEAIAFETFEGRVDLPDVERPETAGGVLELGLQLVAMALPVIEER